MEKNSKSLLDYFFVVLKWRWLLIRNVVIVTIISLIISLLWPKTYRSESVIIPPENKGGGLTSVLGGFSINILDESEIYSDNYETIIKSYRLRKKLVEKFNLFEVYDVDNYEHMMKKLEEKVEIESGLSGGLGYLKIYSLKLLVNDDEPERAAEMNNFILNELDSIITVINTKKAKHLRIFIEDRYNTVVEDLAIAESELKEFQKNTGLMAVPEQIITIIDKLAVIRVEISQAEVKREVLLASLGKNHPELIKCEQEITSLKQEYERLKAGTSFEKDGLIVPFNKLPELSMEYIELQREIEIQTKLLEFLLPSFHILDRARIPDYKHKPKRALIVLGGAFITFILSWIYIFMVEYKNRIRKDDVDKYNKLLSVKNILRSNFFGYKKDK